MKKISQAPKITKTLNIILYFIAFFSFILICITFEGAFASAETFHRRITDWQFLWRPDILAYILLGITIILCTLRKRAALIIILYYIAQTFWFYFDLVFNSANVFILSFLIYQPILQQDYTICCFLSVWLGFCYGVLSYAKNGKISLIFGFKHDLVIF